MEILTRAFYEAIEEELSKLLESAPESANEDKVLGAIEKLIPEIIQKISKSTKNTLLSDAKRMLEERSELFSEFCKRNYERWQSAFDLLETFIVICTEAGASFNKSYRPKAVEKKDVMFDVIVRHHARACHIAQEILCLLKAGFADGAHARWRALHEVNVTANFVEKHGRECAERFYLYEVTESYKGMLQHREYEQRLQAKGPTAEELADCKKSYDQLINKYGKPFGQPYGWASHIITGKRVTFADIEKDVSLDHWRPYYKWASQNVHAGAKGIRKKLGLCKTTKDILLVGQSNSGMTDPAHATAISLAQITATLLTIEPNIDRLVIFNIISDLENEIGEVFLKCDKGMNSK